MNTPRFLFPVMAIALVGAGCTGGGTAARGNQAKSTSGCTLNCEDSPGRLVLTSSCEAEPLISTETGGGWDRFTWDVTKGKTGRKYHFWGNVVTDPGSKKSKYFVSATGGVFGQETLVCKSADLSGTAASSALSGVGSQVSSRTMTAPPDFKSSIQVPACEKARAEGRITADTYLCMVSSKGEWVGGGETWVHIGPKSGFKAERYSQGESAVKVTVTESGESWDLEFGMSGGKTFGPGLFADAVRYRPFQDQPGLSVSGHSRGCSEAKGRFEILELDFEGPLVRRLAVNFEQSCVEGNGGLLSGVVRFNSTIAR